jgi:hypothetical protein
MLARQINLHVSADFVIPEVYTKGTLEEVEEALWIGASIQQSVRTRRGGEEASLNSLTIFAA